MKKINASQLSVEDKRRIRKKLIVLIIIMIIFVIDLIYVTISNRNERKKYYEEMQKYQTEESSGTELSAPTNQTKQEQQQELEENNSEIQTSDDEEVSDVFITNMDSYIVPMLKENSALIEKSLSDFSKISNIKVGNAQVIDVVCKDDEEPFYLFFIEGEDGIIFEVSYNIDTKDCETITSIYTKDEVLSGIWNGDVPACRDEDESTVTN